MIEKRKEKEKIPAKTAFPFGTSSLNKSTRIIFMGTPEFAVASLNKLLESGHNIVAVVTAPDKPAGRGMLLQQSAVKIFAESKGLTVLQPEKLKDPVFIKALEDLDATLQIVVAFRMLPEIVWNMPPMGTVNLHGSLLPQYRGAAPINWAIINGEKFTGVTSFKLKHEIDTGNILLQRSFSIGDDDDAGQVHDRMKEIGADLLTETVTGLIDGVLKEKPQEELVSGKGLADMGIRKLHHAPKIFPETCKIDWNKSAGDVYNLIRGLSPYPGAFTEFQEKKLKIFKAAKLNNSAASPGSYETDKRSYLHFASGDGAINIQELQLEGKKKMNVQDFLRGYRFLEDS